jgi:two-component system phosphate regulon sensor histidine kinase PhoR
MEMPPAPTILDGIPMPALLIAADGRIAVLNAAARASMGDDLLGRLYLMTFRQPALADCIEAALHENTAAVTRYIRQVGAGEQIFRVTVTPVPMGAMCAFEDISEQEQVGQLRRDFVANVSHELRTPLTALMGFIETLQGAARNDSVARDRFLAVMGREAGRMNRLVGDLLSLSRVEAQERVRPTQTVNISQLLARVLTDLRPVQEAARVKVDLTSAPDVMVRADTDQMVQVFTNLIENAVKYGGSDKLVRIVLQQIPSGPALRSPAVQIDVIDQGEGIDAIHLPRLTERFYRVDTHRSREKGGTGLGLAIVKHIINRHRGRLLIASEKGVGSTFSVLLPLEEVTIG